MRQKLNGCSPKPQQLHNRKLPSLTGVDCPLLVNDGPCVLEGSVLVFSVLRQKQSKGYITAYIDDPDLTATSHYQ